MAYRMSSPRPVTSYFQSKSLKVATTTERSEARLERPRESTSQPEGPRIVAKKSADLLAQTPETIKNIRGGPVGKSIPSESRLP